ncbi:MAG: YqjF family protein [Bryobacteraceae bacterium]
MPASFLTAQWRSLAMLNYTIDPAVLRPRLPRGLELDSWNGAHWISMVGFLFLDTRLAGVPVPFHRRFEEVNLRFYVRRRTDGGWRRGVVFIKEIVPRIAVAALARLAYGENYVALPMRHSIGNGQVGYEWRFAGKWNRLALTAAGEPLLPDPGSGEEFITEHYWGYSEAREYRVEHPRWRIWRASASSLECDAARLYGAEFATALGPSPRSAYLAEGSAVTVFRAARFH